MDVIWTDLGSFDAVYSVREKDIYGNVVDGEYVTTDGINNLIYSSKLVASVGVSDLVVIDTDDILVICPKTQSQNIGSITALLSIRGNERVERHTTVHRPLGKYTILLKTATYLVKRLILYPHKRISLQYHHFRNEHWVIVDGIAEVTNGNDVFSIVKGESTFIPCEKLYQLENKQDSILEVMEV